MVWFYVVKLKNEIKFIFVYYITYQKLNALLSSKNGLDMNACNLFVSQNWQKRQCVNLKEVYSKATMLLNFVLNIA